MESLVPALVAALLAGLGDRPARLAAALASAGASTAAILAGALMAQAVIATIAVVSAGLVAPHLTPNARALVVGVALIAAGAGAMMRRQAIGESQGGAGFFAALTGTLAHGIGDRTALLTFAFAVRGPSPLLAGLGGATGAVALAAGAAVLAAEWVRVASSAGVRAAGGSLMIAGLVIGAGALRLT